MPCFSLLSDDEASIIEDLTDAEWYSAAFTSTKLLEANHCDFRSLIQDTATAYSSPMFALAGVLPSKRKQNSCGYSGRTFQDLPLEIRQHIFSYVVTAPQSVHVYEARDSLGYVGGYGWRLSLCEDHMYDLPNTQCKCQQGQNSQIQSRYFDNALLLVSKATRREALDVFISGNKFTFCSFEDIGSFSRLFSSSVAKIKSLRVLVFLQVYHSNFAWRHTNGLANIRQRLVNLRDLDLQLRDWISAVAGEIHEDYLIGGLCSFAFPRVTNFTCKLHLRTSNVRQIWSEEGYSSSEITAMTAEFIRKAESKLNDIFRGSHVKLEDITLQPHPTEPRRRGQPPTSKRSLLALTD